ncbi:MAG: secretin and TonB N-terminal domain-containing protein [Candidatus Brocadiales bacterium]|nr:secretin and TonB N-terminal domain-containing protein [Candidatus Brocadiales bacterium]
MFFSKEALKRALFVLLFLTGCAKAKLEPILSRPDEVKPPEEERVLTDLPVLQLEEKPKKPKPERLYTLSVRNASVKDVLLSFSKESNVNIIVDPDVSGEVTADLKDVTLVQALDALLTPLGLEYTLEPGFVRVSRQKLITRLFHLNYIGTFRQSFRSLASSTSSGFGGTTGGGGGVAGGGITGGGVTGGAPGGGITGGGGGSSGFNAVSGSDIQDIFREIELGLVSLGLRSTGILQAGLAAGGGAATTTTTAAGTLGGLGGTLPMGAKGLFSINRQAGIVMITAFPDTVVKAAELLEAIEGTIQRQVLIEAKIVEVTLRDAFRFGLNWEAIFIRVASKNNAISLGQGLSAAERTLLGTPQGIRTRSNLGLAKDITRVEGITQFSIGAKDTEAILEALTRQGDVNVISSPKVSTLNNQTAIIRVGTQETFFAGVVQRQTVGGVITTTEGVVANPVTIGVTLDVTPQISASGIITMNIHPSITDKTGITKSRFGDEAPILDIREMDTVIRVKDGETIVLGGLMQEKKEVTENRTPALGKIPGLGWLFKDVTSDKKKTDLVIFLTPTVLLGERIEDLSMEEMERLELIRGR